jgi:hypothetical protein
MFNHPYRKIMDSWDAGRKPFGTVVPAGPPPGWSPTGLREGHAPGGDGSNARKLVDAMTGKVPPLTAEGAFAFIVGNLAGPGNDDLTAAVVQLRDRILQRLEEQRQARRGALELEREELRGECRQRLDRVRSLRTEMNSWDARINAFGERSSTARAVANAIRADEPAPENYPTPSEIQEWTERLRAAEAVVAEAEKREYWAENERRSVMLELQTAIEAFQAAEQKETVLAARLEGRPYPGPYGITHPAENL